MANRHRVREIALQVLFAWDAGGAADADAARQVATDATADADERRDAIDMATATWEGRGVADSWVERLAPQWPPRRQPGVDRAILRLAVWELTGSATPPKVVLDEAIELAKSFSTEQSPSFVNGVLDAVLREKTALVGARSQEPGARREDVAGSASAEA